MSERIYTYDMQAIDSVKRVWR